MLERRALARVEKQLRSAFEPGEHVLDFDFGRDHERNDVQAVATTHALYVTRKGSGAAARYPYRTWVSLSGDRNIFAFGRADGFEYLIDFGPKNRGLATLVVETARHHIA